MLVVHQLAGILLDMDALDTNGLAMGIRVFFIERNLDNALTHDRMIKLGNLVTLRRDRP